MDNENLKCWFEFEIERAEALMKKEYNPMFNGVYVGHKKQIELNKEHIRFCKKILEMLERKEGKNV